MKQPPKFSSFVIRVGGFFAVIFAAIFTAKAYFPGHEANVILVVCAMAVVFAVVERLLIKKKNEARKNHRGLHRNSSRQRMK